MAKRSKIKDYDQFVVRLPPGLRDRIKSAADANNQSMNAEIVTTLQEAYPQPLSIRELVERTRKLVQKLRSTHVAEAVVELHNVLVDAEHELQEIGRPTDEDQDPSG